MSSISSISQPTFSYQVDPILNISPLIDVYSECLTHVVDTDGLLHFPAHKSPIILSHKMSILNPSPCYQKSFARVRSPRCLLTIASFFLSWKYNKSTLRNFIVPRAFQYGPYDHSPAGTFAAFYPQIFIILTNRSARSIKINYDDITGRRYYSCKLFFILQLFKDAKGFPKIFGVLSADREDTLSFNCSTYQSCRDEMERTTVVFGKFFQAASSLKSNGSNSDGEHPFRRGALTGMLEATTSLIFGRKDQRLTYQPHCEPSVSESHAFPRTLTESFAVGKTPTVKFVTTAGVFTPQSSYRVYLSPFWPAVWLGIVLSATTCLLVMVGSFRMQSHRVEIGLLSWTALMAHWVFATSIGQYHHSDIPGFSGCLSRNFVRIVTPVVLAWFVLSAFLVNVYSAIFSSDATRSFYYLTNYTDYFQLPLDTMTYVLLNESNVTQLHHATVTNDTCADKRPRYRCYVANGPTACNYPRWIGSALAQLKKATSDTSNILRDWKITQEQRRLNLERWNSWSIGESYDYVCANTETLSRLLRSEKPLVFLMADHDFQTYWKLFVELMQSDPTIKVANNFYSDHSFLSRPVSYEFTGGLHPALKDSILTRMKIILSSGVYDLWEKWHRIKFTDGGLQHSEKKLPQVNKVDPMSFDNSGTPWVFQAMAIAWLVALAVLVIEVITEHFTQARFGVIVD